MDTTSSPTEDAEDIANKADYLLQDIDTGPFSDPAFLVLKGKVTQYVSDIVNEAAARSRRDKSDSISAKHVEEAAEHLTVHTRDKIIKHLGTLGGILFGAFLSTLSTIYTSNQYSPSAVWSCVILGVIGTCLLTFSIAKE